MTVGLIFAAVLVVLGLGTGARQVRTLRRLGEEPYTPEVDRRYYRGQVRRRAVAAVLLLAIGVLIAAYYLSGMDARMDALGERGNAGPPSDDDKAFMQWAGAYWIGVLLLLGAVVWMAVLDFWATRVYWLARYREIKTDHDTKLRRDLAVYRQQKLNDRAKGLKPPTDDTTPEGDPPVA
ncbi:unnamed protein product [Gemmataceae bacterium]|nr:unnamed protein product [Gemmataceae bacterium]VTT99082.1 unnamed protein product [Gemmataceae bacterium]